MSGVGIMMWLTWRQFRVQALVATCLLALLAIYTLITGPHISHVFNAYARHCLAGETCNPLNNHKNAALTKLIPEMNDLVTLVPVLIGMFWGAPLVAREVESGSIRLVFVQGISRSQWLRTKLLGIGFASVVVAGLVSLMVTWWAATWDHYNYLPFGTFNERNIVPISYALFSFTLGVLVGMLLRRTVPAMATTLVLFVAANAAIGQYVRPHLPGFDDDNRYWTLQWTESAIYVALALALGYCSVRLLKRRQL
jgi:ABC-type transport system involved in multi-copper enzyme maturation permease subunit